MRYALLVAETLRTQETNVGRRCSPFSVNGGNVFVRNGGSTGFVLSFWEGGVECA